MSFKRDGDDINLLKNLQHRRVSEILGDFIPDDEALLLSNGRLTCTVCSKRPIFDTIQMLSIHRKGKNHLLELSHYLQDKRNLALRNSKKIQEHFLKTGKAPDPETKDTSLTFITYTSSNSKRNRYNKAGCARKFVLDITETCGKIQNDIGTPTILEPSANSQVRHYLKSLSRKRPLEKTVSKLRENYGSGISQGKQKSEEKLTKPTTSRDNNCKKINDFEIKLLESGWKKDSSNQWVKDPDVEFDSDEDEPPVLSHDT